MILKILAMFTMLIDHIGLFNDIYLFRIIGRLSFPIFAYLVATGVSKTKNINRYALRMLFVAIVSQFVLRIIGINILNILFSYFLFIKLIEYINKKSTVKLSIVVGMIFILVPYIDYSFYGFCLLLMFYYIKDFKLLMWSALVLNTVCYLMSMIVGIQFVSLISLVLIQALKDDEYKKNSLVNRFCYIFYPAHLLVIALI